MNITLKNILAVIAGLIFGSVVNMGIIMISSSIIAPPEGVDVSNMESLKANMHLFEPRHFLFPFLAHAIGTFAGAFLCNIIAANRKMTLALIIGAFFFIGGLMNVFMLPSPIWFTVVDLGLAYIPMAWIGGKLGKNLRKA